MNCTEVNHDEASTLNQKALYALLLKASDKIAQVISALGKLRKAKSVAASFVSLAQAAKAMQLS